MKNVLATIKQLMNDKNINYLLRIYLRISFLIYFLYFINSKLQLIGNLYVFFYSRPDQFADILKLIYSFTHIFSIEDLLAMQVPENWIYKNPYNSVIYSQGATSNMGTTPLTIVFLTNRVYPTRLNESFYDDNVRSKLINIITENKLK